MISGNTKILLLLLSSFGLFFLSSCHPQGEEPVIYPAFSSKWCLCNRTCSHIDVNCIEIAPELSDWKTAPETGVQYENFCISANVVQDENYAEIIEKKAYGLMEYRRPGDDYMEEQIKRWIVLTSTDRHNEQLADHSSWLPIDTDNPGSSSFVEYRTEDCTSLSITSSEELFGREAGTDLSDCFELLSGDNGYSVNIPFLFTSDKQFLGPIEDGMTIEAYLSYSPKALQYYYFHLSAVPQELPVETDFTVDVGLGDGRHLVNVTHVRLLAK